MVLATDEVFTYVIFNYVDMQWTSHTEAGGDTTGGEGGVPAFVSYFNICLIGICIYSITHYKDIFAGGIQCW